MRKGFLLLATALVLAGILATAAYADGLPSPSSPPPGPLSQLLPPSPFKHPHNYINPFANAGWEPARTDMGVDWIPTRRLPVLAIGDAVILGAESHASWPGHRIIWYQLLDGSHAGAVVYVAEALRHLAKVGSYVAAGQPIAVALPHFPYTEWGWADSYGSPLAYPCYNVDGKQTRAGKEMARFMRSLGAQVANEPGPGPSAPQGRRCQ